MNIMKIKLNSLNPNYIFALLVFLVILFTLLINNSLSRNQAILNAKLIEFESFKQKLSQANYFRNLANTKPSTNEILADLQKANFNVSLSQNTFEISNLSISNISDIESYITNRNIPVKSLEGIYDGNSFKLILSIE